jgi:D-arginine dehydrogenase
MERDVDVAVIGAGIVGIATAYYLFTAQGRRSVALIDPGQPMGLTSARSGDNYRNWWPHRVMTEFTDHSIGLMEEIARKSGDRLHMTRRGYALATRNDNPVRLVAELRAGYGAAASSLIRVHERGASSYRPPLSAAWEEAPDGVDVLLDRALIRRTFPSFAPDIACVLHIRRAGDISGQQLGQYMLERIRAGGGKLLKACVTSIEKAAHFTLELGEAGRLRAEIVVNAAGPYVADIAAMLGETLPVTTVLQQKMTFEDRESAVPRTMPFAIDLDGQQIDWSEEERTALAADPAHAWLAKAMPGGIHCRPDGGEAGRWIKLGWAYNREPSAPVDAPAFDPHFPEVVLRGASRLQPALKTYYGRLPRNAVHYGGYYTMTRENWPLLGPMRTEGAFVAGALSGFGTMAACASGALVAAAISGIPLPAYAKKLTLARYEDAALMAELAESESKGVL